MADRELRKMTRTELIEIIYALQQNERSLRTENEDLRRQLDDKLLRIEQAGSIAEAALSLNHIFEDAETAAQQYLDSLKNVNEAEAKILADAQQKADELTASAQAETEQAAGRLRQTEEECRTLQEQTKQECQALRKQTEEECQALKEKTEEDIIRQRTAFFQWGQRILRENPEMASRMRAEVHKNKKSEPQTQRIERQRPGQAMK